MAALSLVLLLLAHAPTIVVSLQVHYYRNSCPRAEIIVKQVVQKHFLQDPSVPAGLLRLHFHDCFVRVRCSRFLRLLVDRLGVTARYTDPSICSRRDAMPLFSSTAPPTTWPRRQRLPTWHWGPSTWSTTPRPNWRRCAAEWCRALTCWRSLLEMVWHCRAEQPTLFPPGGGMALFQWPPTSVCRVPTSPSKLPKLLSETSV